MTKNMMMTMVLSMLQQAHSSVQASPMVEVVLAHHNEDLSWLAQHGGDAHFRVYTKGIGEGELLNTAMQLPPGAKIKMETLPNVGRESYTYLSHIVNNYDNLAGWTVFSQAGKPSFGYKGHRSGGGHLMAGDSFAKYLVPHPSGARFVHTAGVHLPSLDHVLRASYCIESDLIEGGRSSMCPAESSKWTPWWENTGFRKYVDGKRKSQNGEEIMSFYHKYINPSHTGKDVITFFPQGARFAVSRETIQRRPKADYERLLATLSNDVDPYAGYYMEWLWSELFLGHQTDCSMPAKKQLVTHADAMENLKKRFPVLAKKRQLMGAGSGPVPSPSPAVVTTSAEPTTPVVATLVDGTATMSVPDCIPFEESATKPTFVGALKKAYAIAMNTPESTFTKFTATCIHAPTSTKRRLTDVPGTLKVEWEVDLAGQPDIEAAKEKVKATPATELTKDSQIELCAVHYEGCGTVAVTSSSVKEATTTMAPPCAPVTTKWVDPCTAVPTPAPVNPCATVPRKDEQTSKVQGMQRMTSMTPIALAAAGFLLTAVVLGIHSRRRTARNTNGSFKTLPVEDAEVEDEVSEAEGMLLGGA